jgi:hypothetical protein
MKKFIALILILGFMGCATHQVSPVDRALIYIDQYEALELTYKNQYDIASEAEKEFLSEKVAPILDSLRMAIIYYTKVVMAGNDDVDARIEIIQLARKAALKLSEELQ